MRIVVQRVHEASVVIRADFRNAAIDGQNAGKIGRGLLVLAGFENADSDADLEWMVGKIVRMRLFPDKAGVMNSSVQEVAAEILAVSQFTLYASVKKGNRPSWSRAARGDIAEPLFRRFVEKLERELGKPVATGVFAADMQVSLVNDGPVTIFIDSKLPE
jgi:D-tyrosyl-tRNA(Tyr) deacylase